MKRGIIVALLTLAPHLQANEQPLDLGVLFVGRDYHIEVPITNPTAKTVKLVDAASSCSCAVPQVTNATLLAGETTLLPVHYQPPKAGSLHVDLVVALVADDESFVEKRFVAEVVDQQALIAEFGRTPADLLSVDDVHPVWIDLRDPAAFESARIPGAIRMERFAIQGASRLKREELVMLVSDGTDDDSLLLEARKLQRRGWKNIQVLLGGIRAWQIGGGQLESMNGKPDSIAQLQPLEAQKLHHHPDWTFISVDEAPSLPGFLQLAENQLTSTLPQDTNLIFVGLPPTEPLENALRAQGRTAFYLPTLWPQNESEHSHPEALKINNFDQSAPGLSGRLRSSRPCGSCP